MTTTISKKFEVNEPIDKVWNYLTDPEKIVVCVPGASLKEKIDDKTYKGGVTLKFGPVKASYNGEITFEEVDEANRKMTLKGKGLDSKGKGSADMLMKSSLEATDTGTSVDCSMQLSIVGKLAQFGARLINDVSDQLFNQFVDNFKATLAEDTTTADAAPEEEKKNIEESTAEKAMAVEKAAAAVEKAVADVKKAQEAVSQELKEQLPPSNGLVTPKQQPKASATPKAKKANTDNSLNAFSLLGSLLKGWISRLFGGGK
jgi:carbon monoxide dehydrogenase subunit G